MARRVRIALGVAVTTQLKAIYRLLFVEHGWSMKLAAASHHFPLLFCSL